MAAIERLLAFDGKASAESEAAADLFAWRHAAEERLAKLPDRWFTEMNWPPERITRDFAETLIGALVSSVDARVERYGTAQQALGDLMRAGRGNRDYPVGGVTLDSALVPLCVEQARAICDRTMRAFGIAPDGETGRFRIVRGSQAVRLVQFSDPIEAYTLFAFGQSDDPESPHYDDQARLFSEKRMKRAYFSRAELEGHIDSERVLTMPEPGHAE